MRPIVALWIAALLAGCRAATPLPDVVPAPPPASAEEAAPALPNDVQWARSSAEHRALYLQTYRLAGERLAQRVASLPPGTWAVALDADETVIDNSLYQKELFESGEEFRPESWDAWVARREAPPLPGALGFLARVRELGGRIAIVTNRRQHLCADTEADFEAFDIPFDVILCRTGDGRKEPRWQSVREGTASPDLPPLDIVMWLGDNIRDFPGLDQDVRLEPESAFDGFGVELFVLPNPMYGSWRDNPED